LEQLVHSWSQIARRIRVPLGFSFVAVYFWLAQPTLHSISVGALIAVAGLGIRTLASGHVQKNEQLTMSGPYAYVRNPLYFGSVVLAVGLGLAARNWWIAACLFIMFVAIYLPVIWAEETFLRTRFPEYDEYSRQVPRLLPRFSAFGNARGSFSWDLYCKHREYNAVLGTAAIIAFLIAKLVWFS
jgi:protein-S-isoprenylcysteine O-methyltransferase Ste14